MRGRHFSPSRRSRQPPSLTPRTYVFTDRKKLDLDAWFDGLRRGHTFVSNGPAVFLTADGKLPGSALKPRAGDRIKVRARAQGHAKIGLPDRLEIVTGDGIVKRLVRQRSEGGDLVLEFDLPVTTSGWIAASATCKNGAISHTTPVYLVVNNRPTWSSAKGPALIRKQLAAIIRIEKEFAADDSLRAKGVRERLGRARAYYAKLLKAMQSSSQ